MDLPELGDRVGVRLTIGGKLVHVREGVVEDRNGWVRDAPVWVRFNARVAAWFGAEQIVRRGSPEHCPACGATVPGDSTEDVRGIDPGLPDIAKIIAEAGPPTNGPLTVDALEQALRDAWREA